MSRSEFLGNVREAAHFLAPTVQSDGSLDNTQLARTLRSAEVWLTPSAVKGYDENDFSELPPDELRRLSDNVDRFATVARTVPNDQPASKQQVEVALPAFRTILEILKVRLDPEAVRAHQLLEGQEWPDYVRDFKCEAGEDSSGDPCLWVWFVIDDEIPTRKDFGRIGTELREKARNVLRTNGIERFPYFGVRSASEREAFYAKSQ